MALGPDVRTISANGFFWFVLNLFFPQSFGSGTQQSYLKIPQHNRFAVAANETVMVFSIIPVYRLSASKLSRPYAVGELRRCDRDDLDEPFELPEVARVARVER